MEINFEIWQQYSESKEVEPYKKMKQLKELRKHTENKIMEAMPICLIEGQGTEPTYF
jgi:hypothetical protein